MFGFQRKEKLLTLLLASVLLLNPGNSADSGALGALAPSSHEVTDVLICGSERAAKR